MAPCRQRTLAAGATFDPCPVQNYLDGGYGFYQHLNDQRFSGVAALTWFAKAAGL